MAGRQSSPASSGSNEMNPPTTVEEPSAPLNAVSKPPPGLSNGEALRFGTGTLSAPPPPGFRLGPEERARRANQLLWSSVPDNGAVVATEDIETSGWYKQASQHTSSFSNLVAALGSGLAESMEDSTRDQKNSGDTPQDPQLDLSIARHARHAASRLIGTSGNSPNRMGPPGTVYRGGSPPISLSSKTSLRSLTPEPSYPSFAFADIPEGEQWSGEFYRPFSVEEDLRRQSTPLGIFIQGNARAPPTKDIGVTVMEPDPMDRKSAPPNLFEGILSQHPSRGSSRGSNELEREVQALSLEDHRLSPHSSTHSPAISQHRSEVELNPFIWDVCGTEPSRVLVILRASGLHIPDVRSTCEAFGVLETFRSDFSDRGIIFVGYYDIRSAQYAALELEACLKRLAMSERGDSYVRVQYCVPLNSSSAHDESIIVVSNVPPGVAEDSLTSILSSYGSIRSLHRQGETQFGPSNYIVEFHNVQDAKQALMELESTQPWGPDILIEEGTRIPAKRKRGHDLLGLIGRWRQGNVQASRATPPITSVPTGASAAGQRRTATSPRGSSTSSTPPTSAPEIVGSYGHNAAPVALRAEYDVGSPIRPQQQQQQAQLFVAPDGSYSYVMIDNSGYAPPPAPQLHADYHASRTVGSQHIAHAPHGSYLASIPSSGSSYHSSSTSAPIHQHSVQYWQHGAPQPASPPHYHPHIHGGNVMQSSQYVDRHLPPQYQGAPASYYQHHADSSISSSSASAQQQHIVANPPPRRAPMSPPSDDREARHLMLSIDAVESGRDTRTSLMVRNIPNKYTQQMLLSEFTENRHGPGKIDFFYLPIDFKNRCNRGYAFINFVDYRDIVPFHRQYFGQHWKIFNSDKICDITYARIQGKAGMLKRFENSALMEKDDEYKPLVFVSHGADKGKRIPFPEGI